MFRRCWRWCNLTSAHVHTNTHTQQVPTRGLPFTPSGYFSIQTCQKTRQTCSILAEFHAKPPCYQAVAGEKREEFCKTPLCAWWAWDVQDGTNTSSNIFPACGPNPQDLNSMEVSGSVNCHVPRFPAGSVGRTSWEIFPELTPVLGTSRFL